MEAKKNGWGAAQDKPDLRAQKGEKGVNYRIDEFVEEVMGQCNAHSVFMANEANDKEMCVICGRENVRQGLKYSPKIRFSVKMRQFT